MIYLPLFLLIIELLSLVVLYTYLLLCKNYYMLLMVHYCYYIHKYNIFVPLLFTNY